MSSGHLSSLLPCVLAAVLTLAPLSAQGAALEGRRALELVEQLDSPYPSVSAEARRALLAAEEASLPALRRALDEGGFRARAEAVLILGALQGKRLKDGAAGSSQLPSLIPQITRALDDEAGTVRRAAIRALVYLADLDLEAVREQLAVGGSATLHALQEVEGTVMRRRVEEALHSVISPDGSFGTYPGAFLHVGELGEEASAICLRIAADENYEPLSRVLTDNPILAYKVRYLAVSALFEIAGGEIVPDLRRLYLKSKRSASPQQLLDDFDSNLATILSIHGEHEHFRSEIEELERATSSFYGRSTSFRLSDIANMYLKSGRNRSSVEYYRRAAGGSPLNDGIYIYNVACAYSRMRERDLALAALAEAVSLNYMQLDWMRKDGDLDYIRGEPEFREIERIVEQQDFEALDDLRARLEGRI